VGEAHGKVAKDAAAASRRLNRTTIQLPLTRQLNLGGLSVGFAHG
jgi:hypothetical protein